MSIVTSTGTVFITNSTLSFNTAGLGGGGIFSNGELSLNNATLSSNKAGSDGGGIYSDAPVVNIFDSTIDHNTADHNGGGIALESAFVVSLQITNSTIGANTAGKDGGGIYQSEQSTNGIMLTHGTLAYNKASSGGGVFLNAGPLFFQDTLLAGNKRSNGSTPNNFGSSGGTPISIGHNLSDDNSTSGFFTAPGDMSSTPAGLSTSLAANSGRTQTYALLPGSRAIGGGDSSGPAVDQRGLPWLKTPSDIGAF
jgi:predicted outer membrane repeat protein